MSETSIRTFLGDLAKDEELQAKVRELLPNEAGRQDICTAILAVARRSGLTVDDADARMVEKAIAEVPRDETGELQDAALDKVAAGGNTFFKIFNQMSGVNTSRDSYSQR